MGYGRKVHNYIGSGVEEAGQRPDKYGEERSEGDRQISESRRREWRRQNNNRVWCIVIRRWKRLKK